MIMRNQKVSVEFEHACYKHETIGWNRRTTANRGWLPRPLTTRGAPTTAQAACAGLIERTQKRVYAAILRLVRHRETAEDLLQETFRKVWRSWTSFDSTKDELAWVLAIARREVASHYRKVKAQKRGSTQSLGEYEPTDHRHAEPAESLIEAENQAAEARQRAALVSAMEELNEAEQALISFSLAGLTYAEISDRTGRSEAAIGPALTRIREKICRIVGTAPLIRTPCERVSSPCHNTTNRAPAVIRFDGPSNANGDNERDIFALVDLSEAEVEAGWRQFSERHLQPDLLFRLAVGLENRPARTRPTWKPARTCRATYQEHRSVDLVLPVERGIAKGLTPVGEHEVVQGPTSAAGNGKPFPAVRSSSAAQLVRHAPDILYDHLRIEGPILFPGNEVATESWQFGRILHIARTNPKLAEQLTDTIAEHAKSVLLPHLNKDNVMLVCFGRAMHRCGTRLATLLDDSGFGKTHVVLAHDFYSPTLICDAREFQNAEVFVLVDVLHTGGMLNRLMLACREYRPLRVRGASLDRPE